MVKEVVQISGEALWRWWREARDRAITANIDPAEADWLIQAMAEVDGLALRLGTLRQQPAVACRFSLKELEEKWRRRVKERVPVQQLAGYTQWRDLTLAVSAAVLIPRPETELMIDVALEWLAQQPQQDQLRQGHWVDLGTGSGAIALALAKALPEASVHGVDLSGEAIAIATENARQNHLGDRVTFHSGSWLEPLAGLKGQLAAIVSNPPYIPSAIVPTLEPEVANHEPRAALDGGTDGLEAIRILAKTAPDYLVPGGLWLVEMMQGQGEAVVDILTAESRYQVMRIINDLAGRDRFVLATRKPSS